MKTFRLLSRAAAALFFTASAIAACSSSNGTSDDGADAAHPDPSNGDTGSFGGDAPGGKRAFVTSQTFDASFALAAGSPSGAASADALCQRAADAAKLGGTWHAFVYDLTSSPPTKPEERLVTKGPYYELDGTLLFSDVNDLVTQPRAVFDVDEHGQSMTRTPVNGHPPPEMKAWVGDMDDWTHGCCEGWTEASTSNVTNAGVVGAASHAWRFASGSYCGEQDHLYCFED